MSIGIGPGKPDFWRPDAAPSGKNSKGTLYKFHTIHHNIKVPNEFGGVARCGKAAREATGGASATRLPECGRERPDHQPARSRPCDARAVRRARQPAARADRVEQNQRRDFPAGSDRAARHPAGIGQRGHREIGGRGRGAALAGRGGPADDGRRADGGGPADGGRGAGAAARGDVSVPLRRGEGAAAGAARKAQRRLGGALWRRGRAPAARRAAREKGG